MAHQPTYNQLLQQNHNLREQLHVASNLLKEFARPILQYSVLIALFKYVVGPNCENPARARSALEHALGLIETNANGAAEMSDFLLSLPNPIGQARINAAHPERYLSLRDLHEKCLLIDRVTGTSASNATIWSRAALYLASNPAAAGVLSNAWNAANNN